MKHSEEALKLFSSMTSMEICKVVEDMLKSKYGKVSEIEKIWLSTIRKDLEMLEILKRNLYVENGSGKFKGIQIIQCSLGNQHSEEFDKVKEWLENE